MKYLILLLLSFVISGCDLFNDPDAPDPVTVTSTIPADIFNLAGGDSIEITQEGATTLTSQVAAVRGTSYVFTLPDCEYAYDVKIKEPVDYLFWLTNVTVTVLYDPLLINCANLSQCQPNLDSVGMSGSTVTGTFSCP